MTWDGILWCKTFFISWSMYSKSMHISPMYKWSSAYVYHRLIDDFTLVKVPENSDWISKIKHISMCHVYEKYKHQSVRQQTWSSCSMHRTWKYLKVIGRCSFGTFGYLEISRWTFVMWGKYNLFQPDNVLMIQLYCKRIENFILELSFSLRLVHLKMTCGLIFVLSKINRIHWP